MELPAFSFPTHLSSRGPELRFFKVYKKFRSKQIFLLETSRDMHSVKKISGIDHSKCPLKEIVKNLFGTKLAPLSSILTWSPVVVLWSADVVFAGHGNFFFSL